MAASGQEDVDNSPEAYNQSIYVMVGVPYACFACFGFLIYRGFKKNEQYRLATSLGRPREPRSPETGG